MEVMKSEPNMSEKIPIIEVNDILDELNVENKRLRNELLFANKYIGILSKFKLYLDKIYHRFETNVELKSLYVEFNSYIIEKTFNENNQTIIDENSSNYLINNRNESMNPSVIQLSIVEKDMKSNELSEKMKVINKRVTKTSDKQDLKSIEKSVKTIGKKTITKSKSRKTAKNRKIYEYECDIPECNYIAFRPQVLLDHKNSHLGLRPYKCTEFNCNKTFSMSRNLRKHVKTCHTDDKPIKCPECNAQMMSKMRLKVHLRKHTGEKPFVCEWAECDYKTTQSVNLQHHQNSKHLGQRPYKCELCNADFVYPGSLHSHLNSVHTNEKKFKCDWPQCQYSSKHKKSFVAHKLSHSDIKPYTCDWPGCDYGTRRTELLRNHKFIHTGERNYLCSWPACEKRFKTQKALREHLMIHNDDKRYVCKWPGCDYRCCSSGNIIKHFNVHHKKN